MWRFFLSMCLGIFAAFSTNVWAEESESYTGYDSIVNELKATTGEVVKPMEPDDLDWQAVALHGGLGLATSYVSITSPNGASGTGLLKGIELHFGMNLFTRLLRAEGAVASYAQEALDRKFKADLKEFELRLVYLPSLQDNMVMRLGTGLVARYMSVDSQAGDQWTNYQSSTPSSLFLIGLERKITPSVSLGPDVSYRSALVSDTIDKSAWDASIRLNATF